MVLKSYNPTNLISGRSIGIRPRISINVKSGVFALNKPAADLIGLAHGSQVILHQNEDDRTEWYLEPVKADGFSLRDKTTGNCIYFQSTALVKLIFDSQQYNGTSGRILVGEKVTIDKRKCFTLITASLTNK